MTTSRLPLPAIILATSLPIAAQAANVLVTPGFEGLPAGTVADIGGVNIWSNYNDTAGNAVIQSAIVHSGTNALQLNTNPTGTQGFSIVYQNSGASVPVATVENTTWEYSFWVYTTGGTGSFDYMFMSSNELNQDQPGAVTTLTASDLPPNTWTLVSGSFVTPDASPDSDRMKANFRSFNGTSTFYIDDVSLSPIPEPASLGLLAFAPALLLRRRRA